MMVHSRRIALLNVIATFFATACVATPLDSSRFIIQGVYDPTGVDVADTLAGHDWSAHDRVTVTCYYPNTVGTSICAGGGDFDKGDGCHGNDTNYATIIKDIGQNCWYRKNFGLSGVVDARQCGVRGDGIDHSDEAAAGLDDADRLNSCMGLAVDNGYSIVSTGGGVIVDNEHNIAPPANVALTCGASAFDSAGADYRIFKNNGNALNLAKAIVLDPTVINDAGTGSPLYIDLTAKNTTLFGCTIEAGAGIPDPGTHIYPNPYSPAVFYPDCDPAYDGNASISHQCSDADAAHLDETRASSLIQREFSNPPNTDSIITLGRAAAASTGIVAQSGASIKDVRVIGFGTCIAEQGPKPLLQNVDCDGSTGISIHNSDVPMIVNTAVGADATEGEAAFKINSIQWDGANNEYQVSALLPTNSTSPQYNFRFTDQDVVWIFPQDGAGAESTSGYWVINHASCSSVGVPACTFDLIASKKSAALSAAVNVNGVPSSVLVTTPYTANLKFVEAGQKATDLLHLSCTSGLTVAKVWPAKGWIFLSGPVSASCTGTHTFTFDDNLPYSGSADTCSVTGGGEACATVDPNFRWGDGLYVENSGGTRAVNCQIYEHLVSWHLYDGARSSFFSNCATGNSNTLPDRNLAALASPTYPSGNVISVLIDGRHVHTVPPDDQTNETDACESDWSNMVLGQHRSTNIVVQSDCDTPNRFANVSVGAGAGNVDLEVDAGGVSLANADGTGSAFMFKADQTTFYSADGTSSYGPFPANLTMSNNRMKNVTLTLENSAAGASTVGCANTFSMPPALNCPGELAVNTITSNTTLDGSSEFWICDTSVAGADITITIPKGINNQNRTFRVKKVDSALHSCNLVMDGASDKLDGTHYTSTTPYPLSAQNNSVSFTNSNGSTDWYITAKVPLNPKPIRTKYRKRSGATAFRPGWESGQSR